MDENTRAIVASNLTIAYLSIKPERTPQSAIAEDMRKKLGNVESPLDKVFNVYRTIYDRLTKSK
jgi:hypothetical protein